MSIEHEHARAEAAQAAYQWHGENFIEVLKAVDEVDRKAGCRRQRTVTTFYELQETCTDSVVRDAHGDVYERAFDEAFNKLCWAMMADTELHYTAELNLPVQVLWEPTSG